MHEQLSDAQKKWHATTKSYVIGFILSIVFTMTAFLLVGMKVFSSKILLYIILTLAMLQAITQLIFFFHLRKRSGEEPDWQNMILFSMISVLLIIVLGSLWIMHDLDMRMMPDMVMYTMWRI